MPACMKPRRASCCCAKGVHLVPTQQLHQGPSTWPRHRRFTYEQRCLSCPEELGTINPHLTPILFKASAVLGFCPPCRFGVAFCAYEPKGKLRGPCLSYTVVGANLHFTPNNQHEQAFSQLQRSQPAGTWPAHSRLMPPCLPNAKMAQQSS